MDRICCAGSDSPGKNCLLTLATSSFGGMGVFAGKDFKVGNILQTGRAILMDNKKTQQSILNNYVFSFDNTTSAFALGYGMVGNFSVEYYVSATRDIAQGEEVFMAYGSHEWFEDRGIDMIQYSPERLAVKSHLHSRVGCTQTMVRVTLSDELPPPAQDPPHTPRPSPAVLTGSLIEDQSGIARAYAVVPIREGEVVEVSRVLIFPSWHASGTGLERYAWFAQSGTEGADVGAAVLLGYGGLYRPHIVDAHASGHAKWCYQNETADMCIPHQCPNLRYGWYRPSFSTTDSGPADSDISCEEEMLISFVATRDIAVGEELTVPLTIDVDATGKTRRRVLDSLLPGNCIATVQNALQQFVLLRSSGGVVQAT